MTGGRDVLDKMCIANIMIIECHSLLFFLIITFLCQPLSELLH